MKDEAGRQDTSRPPPARVVAIASGKGGVGKTNIVTNLAIAVAARGWRVCIIDADTGMANVNIVLGFSPRHGLADVLDGKIALEEALFRGPQGVQVLAGASGLPGFATLDPERRQRLGGVLNELEHRFDLVFVDLAAGADATVIELLRVAHERLIVATPDPTSLTNAYALLKILENAEPGLSAGLIVNQATDANSGMSTFQRLKKVCDLFLKTRIDYLGYVCADPTIVTSIRLRRPIVLLKHDAPASRCFYQLAQTLLQAWRQAPPPRKRFSEDLRARLEPPQESRTDEARGTAPAPMPPVAPTAVEPAVDIEAPAETSPGSPREEAAHELPEGAGETVPDEPAAIEAMVAPAAERAALIEELAGAMARGELPEREAGMILLGLLSASLNGYGRYPVDIRALVNAALNRRELSGEALRHLASQLQKTYRDRFGHELYPVDNPQPRTATKS